MSGYTAPTQRIQLMFMGIACFYLLSAQMSIYLMVRFMAKVFNEIVRIRPFTWHNAHIGAPPAVGICESNSYSITVSIYFHVEL